MTLLYFKLSMIHYHTHKKRKIKLKLLMKFNSQHITAPLKSKFESHSCLDPQVSRLETFKNQVSRIDPWVSRIKSRVEKCNELLAWLISQGTNSSNRHPSGLKDCEVHAAVCDKWLLQASLSFMMKQNLPFPIVSMRLVGKVNGGQTPCSFCAFKTKM